MEIILMGILSLSNIACFILGAVVMQKSQKDEAIILPAFNNFKREQDRSRKEAQKEQERFDAIMRNVENYDGTSFGQEDVPRG